MSNLFWLTEAQMARLQPFFPKSHGKPRVDDRRVLSGIIFINRNGLRWCDAPKEYGPPKTLYNRWKRWGDMGVFARMMEGLASKGTDQKTYVLVGDGEINEGPIWEGALFAAHRQMKNFMVIVDENGFQAMGSTQEVLDLGSIQAKFESFGFSGLSVDGHNEAEIDQAIRALWAKDAEKPKVLVAKTIKGKGVPFMEHDNRWHYTRLNAETHAAALSAVMGGTAP